MIIYLVITFAHNNSIFMTLSRTIKHNINIDIMYDAVMKTLVRLMQAVCQMLGFEYINLLFHLFVLILVMSQVIGFQAQH